MAFFRSGYNVTYIPITAHKRIGKSHIKFRDALRFLLIIFKIGTLYAPLKLFGTISVSFFFLGLSYYSVIAHSPCLNYDSFDLYDWL